MQLAGRSGHVVLFDLPSSDGLAKARELGATATYVPGDVSDPESVAAAISAARARGPLRAVVHCAGRGGSVRLLDKEGTPGSLQNFEAIVRVNLVGTYNVLRLGAAEMSGNDPMEGDRGVFVLTASIAAWEGQIGQLAYSASKAGIVGMTLNAARDLAYWLIRVGSIAPGAFDTPILDRLSDEARAGLADAVPHPRRLGAPQEFAMLAEHIIDNGMLNGETIRLDGAMRMPPR
jgi:NAD(P)-dependent dehydrogenase (short-subunit alcohol dehydrogenase family)